MKKFPLTDSQSMGILKQHEAGVSVAELAHKDNVSTALIYQWVSWFVGMNESVEATERIRSRECPSEEDVRLRATQSRAALGSPGGKVVSPWQNKASVSGWLAWYTVLAGPTIATKRNKILVAELAVTTCPDSHTLRLWTVFSVSAQCQDQKENPAGLPGRAGCFDYNQLGLVDEFHERSSGQRQDVPGLQCDRRLQPGRLGYWSRLITTRTTGDSRPG